MFLLKITNKTYFLPSSITFPYLKCFSQKVEILKFFKKKCLFYCLYLLMMLNLIRLRNIQLKNNATNFNILSKKLNYTKFSYQKPIHFVVNINLLLSNTTISINDIKGNPKIFYSAGMLNLKSKQKTKQPATMISILKLILGKFKIIKEKSVVIHFTNVLPKHKSYITKSLKQQIFIKMIKSYNYYPHNGCRLIKRRRIKIRTKKFLKK